MGDFQNKILIAKFSSTQACQPPASPATGNCPRSCLCKAFSGRQWEIAWSLLIKAHFCFPRICSLLEKQRSNALKTQSERKWESLPLNTIPNSCWGITSHFLALEIRSTRISPEARLWPRVAFVFTFCTSFSPWVFCICMKRDPGLISSASVAPAWIFLSSPITYSIHVIKMASWATTATVHP